MNTQEEMTDQTWIHRSKLKAGAGARADSSGPSVQRPVKDRPGRETIWEANAVG